MILVLNATFNAISAVRGGECMVGGFKIICAISA
jgi:hypothetical protein